MIGINDNLKVLKRSLSGDDYFVLSQMYTSFIGVDGLSIYLCLNNLLKDEIIVRSFLDILGLDKAQTFENSVYRLEGIGLLKRYTNNSDNILLTIQKPLSSASFLSNIILSKALETQIGIVSYKDLRKKVLDNSVKGYTEVTKKFDEVYKNIKEKCITVFAEEKTDPLLIRNEKFDYIVFKMLFIDSELDSLVLDCEEFRNQILKISFLYDLDEKDMKEAVLKSIKYKGDVDFSDISTQAGFIYQKKTPTGFASFTTKETVIYEHKLTSDENELYEKLSSQSIADTLASVSGGKGSLADVRDFIKLTETTLLPVGVINLLILNLARNSNSLNWSYTYIEKAARNWIKAGVNTLTDALILLRDKKIKNKKVIENPEFKEIMSNLSTQDEEEANALKKRLLGGK